MILKRNIRLISMITCLFYILMLFPSLAVFAVANDNEAYKAGYSNGLWEGIDAAYSDLEDVKSKNYYKAMPKDADIISNYDLDKETSTYKTYFIRGFKDGFREGYNTTYDNPKVEAKPTNYDEALGYQMGQVSGYNDYYAGKSNKWTNAVPSTTKLIEMFQLTNEPNAYKNSFVTNFKAKFQEGYETAYRKAKYEPFKAAIERGAADGTKFGEILGANWGRLDYYRSSINQWDRDLPSDDELKSVFLLDNDLDDYSKAFLSAFKEGYRIKYEEAYRTANVNYNLLAFEKGYAHGKGIGIVKGESLARIDLLMGRSNDENRHNFSDNNIINEYKLFNEDEKYREGFISGFREGTKNGYMVIYQSSNFENFMSKAETQVVSINGAQVSSGDNKMSLSIDKGIFYNDVAVSIDRFTGTNINIKMPSKDRYIKSSELYNIRVASPYDGLNRDKLIKLSFEYYGPQSGGIYKYLNDNWYYMPSKIDANSITTFINPESMANSSGTYAVFIDAEAWNPDDLRGHWAKDEIVTYLRRGTAGAFEDNTFRPDSSITRAQLLSCMSKVFKWNIKSAEEDVEALQKVADHKEVEPYKELVSYCLNKGYLKISQDNTIKINSQVSYKEAEAMMKLAMEDKNFSWAKVAEKIMKNKDKRSASYGSMDDHITRAEALYMLYYMTE